MALQVKPRQHKDGRVYRLAVVIDHGKDKKTGKSNREYIYPKVAEYHTYGFDPMWPLQKCSAPQVSRHIFKYFLDTPFIILLWR